MVDWRMGCNASQEEMPEDSDFVKSLPPAEQEIFRKRKEKQAALEAKKAGAKPEEQEQEVDVSRLGDSKGDLDVLNDGPGDELLLRVCRHARWELFKDALAHNKNIHAKDRQVSATSFRRERLCEPTVEQADFTALHWVALHGHFDFAKALLLAGADPTVKSHAPIQGGHGPMDAIGVAQMQGHGKVARMLERFTQEYNASAAAMARTIKNGARAQRAARPDRSKHLTRPTLLSGGTQAVAHHGELCREPVTCITCTEGMRAVIQRWL